MFDPYSEWLGISEPRRPPTLYQLLDLPPAELDRRVITAAVQRRFMQIQPHLLGTRAEAAIQILKELNLAEVTLADPVRRAAYDSIFVDPSERAAAPPVPPVPVETIAPAPMSPVPLAAVPPAPPILPPAPVMPVPAAQQVMTAAPVPAPMPSGEHDFTTETTRRRRRTNDMAVAPLLIIGGIVTLLLMVGIVAIVSRQGSKESTTDTDLPEVAEVKPKVETPHRKNTDPLPPKKKTNSKLDPRPSEKHGSQKDMAGKMSDKDDPLEMAGKEEPKEKMPAKEEPKEKMPAKEEPKEKTPAKTEPVDMDQFKTDKLLTGHKAAVRAVAVAADGKQILSADDDHEVLLWKAPEENGMARKAIDNPAVGVWFVPGGQNAVVADGGGVCLFDAADNKVMTRWPTPVGSIRSLAVGPMASTS